MSFVRNKKISTFMIFVLIIISSILNFYKTPKIYAGSLPSLICIDTPQNNSNTNQNQINVVGWSLDGSGIGKVQVYVDDAYNGDAKIGLWRPDVNNAFPGYLGGTTSGYSYSLDLTGVKSGAHTIMVKSIGKNGTTIQQSVTINKTLPPSYMAIDNPLNNIDVKNQNNTNIVGWSLDPSGISKVQVYVDDAYSGDAKIGLWRPDVNNAFPGYLGGTTSGYSYSLDLTGVKSGTHTIMVKSVGKNGATIQQSVRINKTPPPSYMAIDNPLNNIDVKNQNNTNIVGWSLDPSGISKVQVYVDDAYKGDAEIGLWRPDVNNAFPGYSGGTTSGYNYALNLLDISDGNHTLLIKSVGKSGTVIQQSVKFNKITSPSIMCVDNPAAYSFIKNDQFNISGWSLNAYGVKNVQVYFDNIYQGDASIGISRPDVNNAFPGYTGGINSGFNYNLNTSISEGVHTIIVKSTGNDGTTMQQNISIYKLSDNEQTLSPIVAIDTPSNNMFIKSESGSLNVGGWSINAFGVKKVQIYVDNAYMSDVTTGVLRPDVRNVYPNYLGVSNSGYSYNLNLSSISDGVHTITVKSTGNGGVIAQQSVRVYKFSSGNQFGTSYNLLLSDMVNTQINYGQPVMESGNNWVNADRNTVQHYVDPMNFMDTYGVYQFLRLDYIQGVTVDDLNKILAGKGVLDGKGAQFLAAAQQSNVNPIYLVSHALLETGNGYSRLATGINVNGQTVYNLFGIGAYDSNANYYGSVYAYNKGWFNVDQAIYGGAQWISGDFINNSQYKQNTLYKMRWNPASPGNHQYATDVRWAYNQVYNIKNLIDMVANPSLEFDIPQYK
ncbi:Ig-like domain-containing protein [Clostridium pasteurianum]|uniref:Beta-N-acetylglucosaminidase n=1 Tax=Clostridium pasteurianum BC1 TaxID=86416 RepID=R4K5M8_CLOPA|nr:Ig-like domain-containing protein [Clostridium pasteurianum]AGK97878.1 beta- N-acetylglucosaminidase [Clostridium pasteurianum BC1]